MRKRKVYCVDIKGNIKEYNTIQECALDFGLQRNAFYEHLKRSSPIRTFWFMGYDKTEVEQRAREYWSTDNTNTKELEDQVNNKIAEQNTVIEELMKQLKDQNNKQLKEQNTLIQTLQNEITQLKQAPIQVQSIPQTKPIPETRKPQIDQPTQPVKVEQNNVIPVSATEYIEVKVKVGMKKKGSI